MPRLCYQSTNLPVGIVHVDWYLGWRPLLRAGATAVYSAASVATAVAAIDKRDGDDDSGGVRCSAECDSR